MRFARIQVERFGPFTELSLDFTSLPAGLHVIHGPNEAGKSSFLRAVSALLFGYEPSGENWKHDYKEFKLSAVLLGDRGDRFEFTRLKKLKAGLRSPTDEAISESELHRRLGGLDRATFEAMFSLDADRLRRGGKEIADGAGDLGKLLFAATGLGTVAGVTSWLENQQRELYLPTGKKPAVNERIAEIKDRRVQERNQALALEDYSRCESAKREADAEYGRRKERVAAVELERRRVEGILAAKDDVFQRVELLRQLADLASAPDLPEGAAMEAVRADAIVRSKQVEYSRLQARIADREADLAALQTDDPVLEAAEAVERFLQRVVRHTANVEQVRQIAIQRGAARQEAESLRQLLAGGPSEDDWEALAVRLQTLARSDESAQEQLRRETASRRTALDALFRRLRGWAGDLESLASAATPARSEIEEWNAEFQRRLQEHESLRTRLQDIQRERDEQRRAFTELESQHHAPSEEALRSARQVRDETVDLVDAKLNKRPSAVEESRVLKQTGARSLIDAVRSTVRKADEVVDAMRTEADAVAALNEARGRCERLIERAECLESELAEVERTQEARQWTWRRRWESLPIEVKSPAVMLQWLDDRGAILEKYDELREAEQRLAGLESQERDRSQEIQRILERLGVDGNDAETPTVMVELARRRLKTLEKAADRLRSLEESAEQEERARTTIEDEKALLLAEGRRLAERLGLPGEIADLESIADELQPRLKKAKATETAKQQIMKEFDEAQRQLEDVARERNEAQSRLEGPMRMAGVKTLTALAEADVRSKRKRDASMELAQVETRLRKAAGARPLHEFATEVAAAPVEELEIELERIVADLEAAKREQDRWLEAATKAGVELERMERRGSEAAEARQQAEYALGTALEKARRYAVLRSAQALLESAVREYRERNETKVLQRARELFRRLTNGAYTTLRSDVEGSRDAKLIAVRGDDEVSVADLSEGTRDQLFLALRLSALEAVFEQRGPTPILADDLLTTFDDERTAAALATLAEFARKTQVLLLTHHQHVVDAARKRLPPAEVLLHELTGDVSAASSSARRA